MKKRVYDSAAEKRDVIIGNTRESGLMPALREAEPADGDDALVGYAEAYERFKAYIEAHGKRNTPERIFVLKKIYEQNGPVDIQTLHELVCREEGQVALSTIYNNLAMLIDAHLVRRLDLVGGAMAFFEKVLGVEPHGYVICQHCGKIRTLQIAKLKELIDVQLPKAFLTTDFNLQVNGLCKKCQTALRKEAEAERKAALKSREAAAKASALINRRRKRKK